MDVRKLIYITVVVLVFSVSNLFASPIASIGFESNPLLFREDGTGLLKFSLVADAGLYQNLFTLSNLNAILNEEVVKINKDTMSAALRNGISFSIPLNLTFYGNLRLSQFSLVPYVALEGGLSTKFPKELSELLFGDTTVETNLDKTIDNFSVADLKFSAGLNVLFGDFLIGLNLFVPLLYSYSNGTYLSVRYVSSAEPARASMEVSTRLSYLSAVDLSNVGEISLNHLFNLSDAGLNVAVGYGNNRYGIVLKDLTLKPATARYWIATGADAKFEYSGDGLEFNTSTDVKTIDPTYFQTTGVNILDVPKLSAYYKEDGFFCWGVSGTLAFDGRWVIGAHAGLNLGAVRTYYKLSVRDGFFAHTLGFNFNLFLLVANLSFTSTADTIFPSENSTPGFEMLVKLAAGF
ncbi:hypothetical protein [Fervidobacterium thailandense]|uniref:DUF5723 domain-containing protein n=1 Tax=Fervidobacterium thailandense TaxID=1008305 RepID=A0A1E3G0K8_9BACT|nr:hypothetical protein [Fervidobacterium thailandense]ODN29779.1 hypothetical protein A4H02_08990 [Fervidobacterium thailandense]